ncbi:MAG TPA: hypothetical protein VIY90_14085 [Steroidobacteraceae bacterium]
MTSAKPSTGHFARGQLRILALLGGFDLIPESLAVGHPFGDTVRQQDFCLCPCASMTLASDT